MKPIFIILMLLTNTCLGENMQTKINVTFEEKYSKKIYSQLNWTRLPNVTKYLSIEGRIDQLVKHCADKLAIQLPMLRFNVVIWNTKNIHRERALKYYPDTSKTPPLFYVHDEQTIYCYVDSVSDKKLAHEIGHALLRNYFVMPVPAPVSEQVCMWLDKTLGEK